MTSKRIGPEPATGGALSARESAADFAGAEASALVRQQGAKIRDLRNQSKMTIHQLADLTGLHFNTVGRIERGESEANTEQLLLIAKALGVAPARLAHFASEAPAVTDEGDDEFAMIDMLNVRASAGGGSMNGHNEVIGRFAFRRSWLARKGVPVASAKIIRARGNSMADKINDGDILLVNTAVKTLERDGVYVIEQDGLDYVKLLQRDFATGGLQIISYNHAEYPPQRLTAQEAAELRISGLVVWHGGDL